MKKNYNKLSIIYMFILLIFINVGTALVSMQVIHYMEFSKILFIFGIIAFILYFIYKILYKDKINIKDIFILLLLIMGFLSYYYAFNKNVALNGTANRYEGLKTLFSYYSIFLLSSTIDKKWQKRIMYTLIISGILQIIIGIYQVFEIDNILGYDRSQNWSVKYKFASGTIGNPNFYSTFIILILMYIFSLLINSKNKCKKKLIILLFIFFGYGLIIGNTISCLLASIICVISILMTKINKNNIKKVGKWCGISSLILAILLILFFNLYPKFRFLHEIHKNMSEIKEIFTDGLHDYSGNYRIYVWKKSLKQFPKYYKTGIGIDNFKYIDDGFYICSPNACFDKAHNEYIQLLLTEGIFTFIIYLSFIIYLLIYYRKYKIKDEHNRGLVYAMIAYLIQASFNISVIQVAPVFYMIMGFIGSKERE